MAHHNLPVMNEFNQAKQSVYMLSAINGNTRGTAAATGSFSDAF